jgi:hypothetical protein
MKNVARLLWLGAGLAVFVGAIAHGSPENSFMSTAGSSPAVSWFGRLHLTRRVKARPRAQAADAPTRDAQAVSLTQQAVSALIGSIAITDAKVQGTANYVAGSDQESGTATLLAHVGYEASVGLSLSGGQRSEIRNGSTAPPQGKWSGTDATWHTTPLHSCWTDPTWFFPALTLQSALSDSQISFAYVGQDTKAGVSVQHFQISRLVSGQTSTATSLIQRLSQVDFYLDSTTHLPVAIDFNAHPNTDAGVNQPVEIQFSGWQPVNGIEVPSRIQKLVQGSSALDLSALTVSVNIGLPQSDFAM